MMNTRVRLHKVSCTTGYIWLHEVTQHYTGLHKDKQDQGYYYYIQSYNSWLYVTGFAKGTSSLPTLEIHNFS